MGWEQGCGVRDANRILDSLGLSFPGGGVVPPEAPLLWPPWGLVRDERRGSRETSDVHTALVLPPSQLCARGGCPCQTKCPFLLSASGRVCPQEGTGGRPGMGAE